MPEGLVLFNTLTAGKESFLPPEEGPVKVFSCGPTVQDYMHAGHARTYVFYDTMVRYLRHLGHRVEFLMNITDIDESIEAAAERAGVKAADYASARIEAYRRDMDGLGISTLSGFVRVSEYVPQMIRLTAALLERGYAYMADGIVYFDTARYPHLGQLAHQSRAELKLRPIELSEHKKDLLDFSLWRPAPSGGARMESPWGEGWPGWHIQDTAVTSTHFGQRYDIHGGAHELIYPHHEAEIAQAEALTGVRPFVRYWVHCGLVKKGGRKMSKSEGNIVYAKDILSRYGADAVRLYMLSHHYREDFEFDEGELARKKEAYASMRERPLKAGEGADAGAVERLLSRFRGLMNDDFDSPRAVDFAVRLAGRVDGDGREVRAEDAAAALSVISGVLGVNFVEERSL
ncbi:MAG: class I tRNA ligase family protein [Nitrososphaerota archaeon]|nr:class I tRNA ligase family protein [Nitrososphaerota archaeon]MDG6938814.1 class I tRNA ligase family protein [Nitrososphaerota archaeon]